MTSTLLALRIFTTDKEGRKMELNCNFLPSFQNLTRRHLAMVAEPVESSRGVIQMKFCLWRNCEKSDLLILRIIIAGEILTSLLPEWLDMLKLSSPNIQQAKAG